MYDNLEKILDKLENTKLTKFTYYFFHLISIIVLCAVIFVGYKVVSNLELFNTKQEITLEESTELAKLVKKTLEEDSKSDDGKNLHFASYELVDVQEVKMFGDVSKGTKSITMKYNLVYVLRDKFDEGYTDIEELADYEYFEKPIYVNVLFNKDNDVLDYKIL